MKIFSMKDVKVGFANPFYQVNEEVAKRSFAAAITDKRGELFKIKDDLELWEIGSFDETTGKISPIEPNYLMGGKDVQLEEKA